MPVRHFIELTEFQKASEASQLAHIYFENALHTHRLRGSLITISGIIKLREMCNGEQKWIENIFTSVPLGKCIIGTILSLCLSNHIIICSGVCVGSSLDCTWFLHSYSDPYLNILQMVPCSNTSLHLAHK